jgi:predicted house-cleaning NTP pyrophosphatase (Maf/HAM1 superfamily)
LSECVQNNSDSELRQELLHRIENECAIMREDYDEKICRVTTRIDSLLRDPR